MKEWSMIIALGYGAQVRHCITSVAGPAECEHISLDMISGDRDVERVHVLRRASHKDGATKWATEMTFIRKASGEVEQRGKQT